MIFRGQVIRPSQKAGFEGWKRVQKHWKEVCTKNKNFLESTSLFSTGARILQRSAERDLVWKCSTTFDILFGSVWLRVHCLPPQSNFPKRRVLASVPFPFAGTSLLESGVV